MAKPVKRGNKWFVQVQVKGKRKSGSFPTKEHARQWAIQTEIELHDELAGKIKPREVRDLFTRYAKEVSPKKRGQQKELLRLEVFKRMPLADIRTDKLCPQDIADWRDERLKTVSGDSVNRDWNLLSAVFTHAIKEWRWLHDNPCAKASRPEKGKARSRRPTNDELDKILYCLGHDGHTPITVRQRVAFMVLFAIETAMRAGEICNITWHDVHEKYVHTPAAKNGHSRDVPLSKEARRIIGMMPKEGETVFRVKASVLDATWRKARDSALVNDLHFHDLRREALTRLSKKLPVMDLARLSGHRDLRILMNVYYNPSPDDMSDLLD